MILAWRPLVGSGVGNARRGPGRGGGFTLIELVITVAIVGLIATVAFPMAELAYQRSKERELRDALQQIRAAIDAYKEAIDDPRNSTKKDPTKSSYPPSLQVLVDGFTDPADPKGDKKIYFLRRLPRDPLATDPTLSAEASWGKRSYASPADAPAEGDDVFDVYSQSTATGLNGIPYRQW
jgi:general secretion pathway protein G